jgi:Glyoxalase-like domain
MALARFKDLCIDAADVQKTGAFWAKALGRAWHLGEDGDGWITGPTVQHTIWVNHVPEPKTVKNRVHFDIYAQRISDLEALGSTVVQPQGGDRMWTDMADPEDGEYCAFLREELTGDLLHGLVVDSVDAVAQADWWGRVYGAEVVRHSGGCYATVQNVPGMPILTMDFNFVPEPKTVKNRVHWDVYVPDLPALLDAGATVLAEPNERAGWHVLADPEGNEFCAFADHAS